MTWLFLKSHNCQWQIVFAFTGHITRTRSQRTQPSTSAQKKRWRKGGGGDNDIVESILTPPTLFGTTLKSFSAIIDIYPVTWQRLSKFRPVDMVTTSIAVPSAKRASRCGRIEVTLTVADTAIAARRAANLSASQTAAGIFWDFHHLKTISTETHLKKEKTSGERHFNGEGRLLWSPWALQEWADCVTPQRSHFVWQLPDECLCLWNQNNITQHNEMQLVLTSACKNAEDHVKRVKWKPFNLK